MPLPGNVRLANRSPAGAGIRDPEVRYDPAVRLRDAIEMLAESGVATLGPTTWADLGCGTGTFTLALADLLSPGSTIHAMDRDGSVLRRIPPEHEGVRITTHRGDFTSHTWPFANPDGILMANSLHYVDNQTAFIRSCERRMTLPRRFLIVEYDTDESSRWVPHPVSRKKLKIAVHRRGLLVDHDVAVAAIRVSACCALCRLGYEFANMAPLKSAAVDKARYRTTRESVASEMPAGAAQPLIGAEP